MIILSNLTYAFSSIRNCSKDILYREKNASFSITYHRNSETIYTSAIEEGDRLQTTYHPLYHLSPPFSAIFTTPTLLVLRVYTPYENRTRVYRVLRRPPTCLIPSTHVLSVIP